MKKTLTLCAIAFAASSSFAQTSGDRIHKFIPVTTEVFGTEPGQTPLSPELHVNDIDSISFDVDAQVFTVFGGFSISQNKMNTAVYSLEKLQGFDIAYLAPGYMPSTSVDYSMEDTNAFRLMWRPVEGAAGYEIRYVEYVDQPLDDDWEDPVIKYNKIIVGADVSEIKLEHLAYNTAYKFAVRTLSPKGEGFHSEWSGRSIFRFMGKNSNFLSFATRPRYLVPEVTGSVKSEVGKVTVRLTPDFDRSIYSDAEIEEIYSHFHLKDNRFVVDKLKLTDVKTKKVIFYPVTEADLAAGEVVITDLPEAVWYKVAAYDSSIEWDCDAEYNSVNLYTKKDPSEPIIISSADLSSVLINHMANPFIADNQVFYLEGDKTYTLSENVFLTKGFTLATNPADYFSGKRAKVDFSNSGMTYNLMLGGDGYTQHSEEIGAMIFEGIDFDASDAVNYGFGSSSTVNYFMNSLSNAGAFNIEAIELRDCTFRRFIRGFIRMQGFNHVVSRLKVDGNLFYDCGYYDGNGRGYPWFVSPGSATCNLYKDFEFTNNTIYDSPRDALISDSNKNIVWDEKTKWNIRIENNTFVNFSTRTASRYLILMRYIPGGSYMSVQRNLFVLAADESDSRNLNSSGVDIRFIDGTGEFSFDVKGNYSVGCRDSHLVDDGIFRAGKFSATRYSFGAFPECNNGTAADLVVKVGSTPLKATDLFTDPNPVYKSHIPTSVNELDHAAPDNIFEALRYKQTPEVLNHEIYTLSIGDPRWKK
ncbi:MAG: hypothetical protein K2H17_02860 [Duncaniella sp.]|uniref:hypothetical protein n=1 Tax=Duncaniella sp. TaxID=2518496 RepID=UPI0023CF9197|nr:hypothetical protein [Duncaniella sp.]MDE5988317.1 hypothetical protein [Duncaniella sp.]